MNDPISRNVDSTVRLPGDGDRLVRALRCRIPILGSWRRRRAMIRIAERAGRGDPTSAALLLEAAESSDPGVSRMAMSLLAAPLHPGLVDALCAEAVKAPATVGARACVETGKKPSHPEDLCLYLFATGQLDAYFEEDFEFQNLRLAYDRADPVVKQVVMRVVRSGDRRCVGFFGSRKKLSECTDREIALALQSFLRHADWPRLFRAFLELPVKYGLHILKHLRDSGWEPEEPELRSLLRQAIADARGRAIPRSERSVPPSAAFDRALQRGREGDLVHWSPTELLARLHAADPLEGVAIVAALGSKVPPDSAPATELVSSPHWLVRLAARVSGLSADIVRDEVRDPNHWVRTLSPSRMVLELWPGRATPVHLEALSRAPPEAWEGGLGAARKVLRSLIARRVTVGHFEELVVEGDSFAGEFEPVEGSEWLGGGHDEASGSRSRGS